MKNFFVPYYNTDDCYPHERIDPNRAIPEVLYQNGTARPLEAPITPTTQPQAVTLESTEYLNGYLRTKIGEKVRVEFLIGTGTLVDKFGELLSVGANYITIRQAETGNVVACDFFTIKFISFYY
ncbi:hypothetical protein LY28_01215 [Ruminiclostridium sufflavum DSM 19573]|uniref:Spore coat protein GerQ n=1 Tax=Ruminiclostridium sufflavum DSM 19573 TaxID=1121337 RepID=A0A318XM89_9FIRM|nr:hypothetical protein [Ruminiclostridium sufflavum]PYG88852.1 hypothetical protein LY28_01215 [Ruminiclostridium sufflavum DSM 19573]